MTDITLLELLRAELPIMLRQAVNAEVEPLRRLVEALSSSRLTPQQQRLVQALAGVFGASFFSSDEVAQSLSVPVDTRRELAAALATVCRGPLTSKRIGHALRGLVDAGGSADQWRIVDAGTECGSRLWGIEGKASRYADADAPAR